MKKASKAENRRLGLTGLFVLGSNAYLKGFRFGTIYQGPLKKICVPGLNCYACPGALFSCPIGSLQNSLYDRNQLLPFYVLGFLFLFGSLLGRAVCGLLCPFGWLQDLLSKIPLKKIRPEQRWTKLDRAARKIKYFNLFVLALMLPLAGRWFLGLMAPWFCKLVCPSGLVFGGWPLVARNLSLRANAGVFFIWKSFLAIFFLGSSIRIPRFFCRYFCPLGAFYGFFNRFALYRLRFEKSSCISCSACTKACPMGIKMPEGHQSMECIRCGRCADHCPTSCLHCGVKDRAIESGSERNASQSEFHA